MMKRQVVMAMCLLVSLLAVPAWGKEAENKKPTQAGPQRMGPMSKNTQELVLGRVNGRTHLHDAVISGNVSRVVWLIRVGADVNAPDGNGQTPLHLAIRKLGSTVLHKNKYFKIATVLAESGSDWDARDSSGKRPCDYSGEQPLLPFMVFHVPGAAIPLGDIPLHAKILGFHADSELKPSVLMILKLWSCKQGLYPLPFGAPHIR